MEMQDMQDMSNDATKSMKACMDEVYQRENRELFNDALEELIDACADYREAEQPDSGQGSWGRAMMYNQVLVHVHRVAKLINTGKAPCSCADGGTMIRLKGSPTTCLSCGGSISG